MRGPGGTIGYALEQRWTVLLTEVQQRQRAGRLTASSVGVLMGGQRAKILALWRELIGDPSYQRPNLAGIWAIDLGNATEEINLDRYERKYGHEVTRRGEVVIHPQVEWASATLDGWVEATGSVIECKHVAGREAFETIIARYTPQMFWQMEVTATKHCIFSVIEGANAPRIHMVELDQQYADEMWRRARRFMECVQNLVPPV